MRVHVLKVFLLKPALTASSVHDQPTQDDNQPSSGSKFKACGRLHVRPIRPTHHLAETVILHFLTRVSAVFSKWSVPLLTGILIEEPEESIEFPSPFPAPSLPILTFRLRHEHQRLI